MGSQSLSRKQLKVLESLFTGQMSEEDVLKKYKVSRYTYTKWLNDRDFIEYFYQRIRGFNLQSSLIVARYAPVAAARLIELTESEKNETTRKACLDVISMPKKIIEGRNNKQDSVKMDISEETVSKVMEILAPDKESDSK